MQQNLVQAQIAEARQLLQGNRLSSAAREALQELLGEDAKLTAAQANELGRILQSIKQQQQ